MVLAALKMAMNATPASLRAGASLMPSPTKTACPRTFFLFQRLKLFDLPVGTVPHKGAGFVKHHGVDVVQRVQVIADAHFRSARASPAGRRAWTPATTSSCMPAQSPLSVPAMTFIAPHWLKQLNI
jgi:hypothetical protein